LVTPSKLTCANRAPFGRPVFGHGSSAVATVANWWGRS
jgi:hypothetical protein